MAASAADGERPVTDFTDHVIAEFRVTVAVLMSGIAGAPAFSLPDGGVRPVIGTAGFRLTWGIIRTRPCRPTSPSSLPAAPNTSPLSSSTASSTPRRANGVKPPAPLYPPPTTGWGRGRSSICRLRRRSQPFRPRTQKFLNPVERE
jgi:hypothetical protein